MRYLIILFLIVSFNAYCQDSLKTMDIPPVHICNFINGPYFVNIHLKSNDETVSHITHIPCGTVKVKHCSCGLLKLSTEAAKVKTPITVKEAKKRKILFSYPYPTFN